MEFIFWALAIPIAIIAGLAGIVAFIVVNYGREDDVPRDPDGRPIDDDP